MVPIQQSAAFWHRRAVLSREQKFLPEALELFRRSIRDCPDRTEYRLDMAEVYHELGWFERSNRVLGHLMREEDPPVECLFGLGVNYLAMGLRGAAQDALYMYVLAAPGGQYAEDGLELLEHLAEDVPRKKRGRARAKALLGMGVRDAGRMKMREAALKLRRSLSMDPNQPEAHSMLAMTYSYLGMHLRAIAHAQKAVKLSEQKAEALSVCAMVLSHAGQEEQSEKLLKAGVRLARGEEEKLRLGAVAGQLGRHELARRILLELSREIPYSHKLLHALACAEIQVGAPAGQVEGYFARIRRIDPENAVAVYWEKRAQAGAISPEDIGYAYRVPEKTFQTWIEDMRAAAQNQLTLGAPLKGDRVESRLYWALESGSTEGEEAAFELACKLPTGEALTVLQDMLLMSTVSDGMKYRALDMLFKRGARLPIAALLGGRLRRVTGVVSDSPQGRLTMRFRRALRRRMREEDKAEGLEAHLHTWARFLRARRGRVPQIPRVEYWVAALVEEEPEAPRKGNKAGGRRLRSRVLEKCRSALLPYRKEDV